MIIREWADSKKHRASGMGGVTPLKMAGWQEHSVPWEREFVFFRSFCEVEENQVKTPI